MNNPDGVNLKTRTIMQRRRAKQKLIDKYKKTAFRPKEGEIEKQRKLLNKLEKE